MNTVDEIALGDIHIHIDAYEQYNPYISESRGGVYGEEKDVAPLEKLEHHLTRDNVEDAYCIFSDIDTLDSLEERVPDTNIWGWYWARMPTLPPEDVRAKFPQFEELFERYLADGTVRERPGLSEEEREKISEYAQDPRVVGLKVHPVQDFFAFTNENLADVLDAAREHSLAIIFHTDDRPETAHLTDPELYEEVIRENPDIDFVIGHGGAYAHHRKVGDNNPAAKKYWSEEREPFPIQYSIERALDISLKYDNAFFDTSTTSNRIKARIIGDAVKANPELAHSILIGTDYPLGVGPKVSGQLDALGKHGGIPEDLLAIIAQNRLPEQKAH